MGFSVTITSSILLIVFLAISSSFLATIFQGIKEISCTTEEYLRSEREKFDVALQLTVDSVNATTCNITVKNTGSKAIFLQRQSNFTWTTIILSYGNSSYWLSYPIEESEVLEVKVSGTDHVFPVESHIFIEAGEEAKISFHIPEKVPEIPLNSVVSVIVATHYGVIAKAEAVREQ